MALPASAAKADMYAASIRLARCGVSCRLYRRPKPAFPDSGSCRAMIARSRGLGNNKIASRVHGRSNRSTDSLRREATSLICLHLARCHRSYPSDLRAPLLSVAVPVAAIGDRMSTNIYRDVATSALCALPSGRQRLDRRAARSCRAALA